MANHLEEILRQALASHSAGDSKAAMEGYLEIVRQDSQHADAWRLLGVCHAEEGRFDLAIEALFRAIDLLTTLRTTAGSTATVELSSSQILENLGLYYHNLGDAYRELEQMDEADYCYSKAIENNSKLTFAWNNRGMILIKKGLNEEAIPFFEKALNVELDQDASAFDFQALVRLVEAKKSTNLSAEKISSLATIANNVGSCYLGCGEVEQALRYFRLSTDLDTKFSGYFSNWLMTSLYVPSLDNQAILDRHNEWRDRYFNHPSTQEYRNRRDANRKLRIGYVSPDFRGHAVNSFFESFYRFHDRTVVEPILYAEVNIQDDIGRRLESMSFAWRRTFGLSDDAVYHQIVDDEIDILVDLAGHTAGNRLDVFTRRPAPVQVTYLGYPGQTGLRSEAYCFVDNVVQPRVVDSSDESHFRYLEPCFCCFAPNYETPPIQELPANQVGYVTFGMLHGLSKLNGDVYDLWCDVLKAVTNSKLLMFRTSLTGASLNRVRREFLSRGIEESRIELRAEYDNHRSHLHYYDRIDITLDTFPWSGHTTCTEALWMGVPAITLYGQRHVTRMVSSVLKAIECDDWIAQTKEEFVRKAVSLAEDREGLAQHRRTLRQRMLASPLCDGPGFARKIEALYRQLWQEWLATSKT
jgi:protein O-GlcNAc transferase